MAKRQFSVNGGSNKKSRISEGETDLQEIRVLLQNSEAGCIIGTGGSNVKKIRTETGGFISLLKNPNRVGSSGRIMTIKGTYEVNAKVMEEVAELLIESDKTGVDSCILNILIHVGHSGCIIGKGGQIIRELQNETGAQIRLSKETLGNSTERTLILMGTSRMVGDACLRIFSQLYENPLRSDVTVIPYVPGSEAAIKGNHASPITTRNPRAETMNLSQKRTVRIIIPTVCKGFLLGRGGIHISDIRDKSNVAKISLADPEPSTPNEVVVSVQGQPQAIQHAISLIRGRVNNYKDQQTGNPLPETLNNIRTSKIVIPHAAAGYVIGKGGKHITKIRENSFVQKISIAKALPTSPEDRVVSITGNLENIAVATNLILERVHDYTPK